MAWDKEYIRKMLDQVADTSGQASVQTADTLLAYLDGKKIKPDANSHASTPAGEQRPNSYRTDGKD